MNEKIQHIIQDIRSKKNALNSKLLDSQQNNNLLSNELEKFKAELLLKDETISKLNLEIEKLSTEKNELLSDNQELKISLEETKNQIIASTKNIISNEQIDDLVREIEYCIGQLKK